MLGAGGDWSTFSTHARLWKFTPRSLPSRQSIYTSEALILRPLQRLSDFVSDASLCCHRCPHRGHLPQTCTCSHRTQGIPGALSFSFHKQGILVSQTHILFKITLLRSNSHVTRFPKMNNSRVECLVCSQLRHHHHNLILEQFHWSIVKPQPWTHITSFSISSPSKLCATSS